MSKKESYTAASSFPAKLLHTKVVNGGKIIPYHIQLIPTNSCNLNCSFCSCSDRDKKNKLELSQIEKILNICSKYGTKAMTVTGGGEPLTYNKINDLINYANVKNIEVGLVTNGILLDKLKKHKNLTWCRISSSDDRVPVYRKIENAIQRNPNTDWAFSHVLTKKPQYNNIKNTIEFANIHNFSHIRIVSDLLDLTNVDIGTLEKRLKENNVDDSKVIYQGRKDSTKGSKNCYISLLKPVISPEGVFPCCGVQYAQKGQRHDMIKEMCMGKINELEQIFEQQKHFDGSVCDVCYYEQYNDALSKLNMKIDHKKFV